MVAIVGILLSFFQYGGGIDGFVQKMQARQMSRRRVQFVTWLLSLICFNSMTSSLFVGAAMRRLSDEARVSREKFAFILDAMAAPLALLYPFNGAIVFGTSLLAATGLLDRDATFSLILMALPFNFYAILMVLFTLFVAVGWIKD